MTKINGPRVLLCGLLAGGVWTLLSILLIVLLGEAFMEALQKMTAGSPQGTGGTFGLFANFAGGIWAVWLYAAIQPRFGPGWKTAAITGGAWWFIQTLQSAKWVALIGFPTHAGVLTLAIATLPAMIVSVMAGASQYREK